MDTPEDFVGGRRWAGGGGRAWKVMMFSCVGVLVYLIAASLFSFLFAFGGVAIGELMELNPVPVSSRCRILSSGVDIRSSKVCEFGFFNFKANQVLYPSKRRRFRCRYDYYWASIFEVEYKEYFSGQVLSGVVEVPKAALPVECRPSFGAAWLTKMKFEVNESYDCNYLVGSHVADLYPTPHFNCQAEEPFFWEMTRKVIIISRLLRPSLPFYKGGMERETVYRTLGVASGMIMSASMYIVFRVLHECVCAMARHLNSRKLQVANVAKCLKRVCLQVAYVSLVTWLMLEYGRTVGLNQVLYGG